MTNNNSKFQKVFATSFLILSISAVLLPQPTQAAGLVPCGLPADDPATTNVNEEDPCGFCNFFDLFNNILNFIFRLIPAVAAFMLFMAGIKFFMAVENPNDAKAALDMIKSVIIGLIIIFAAWALVGAFLATIGLNDWTLNIFQNWWEKGLFELNCSGS